jgi:surface carbohydrate biosynthesis protein
MHIYIEIEIVKRELVGKLLIALNLINKNHTVILADRASINQIIKEKKVPKGIVFLKDINSQKNRINDYKKFIKNGFKIVAQDEEIGCFVDKSFEQFYSWRFRGNKSFKFIEKYFCWGNFDFDFLKYKDLKKKFIKTGSARIDLTIDEKLKKYHINKKKNILICLNHNLFWKRGFVERSIIDTEGLDKKRVMTKINTLYLNESKDFLLFSYLINLIYEINKNKNFNLKIRPHPTHDIKKIKDYFKSIKLFRNIKIDFKNDLIDDISVSDFIIQTGCTSAIEATLNKKRVIFYSPKNKFLNNYKDKSFISRIGFKFQETKDVINFLNMKNISINKVEKKILSDVAKIKKRVYVDKNSFRRISEQISGIKINDTSKINLVSIKENLLKNSYKNFKKYIKSKLKNKMNINNDKSVFETKFPPFNEKEIIIKLNKLNKKFKLKAKFSLNQINDRFLILTKNN